MRSKISLIKHLPPTLLSFPSSTSSLQMVQGDRERGLWSVHHTFLPLPRERSPSPVSLWGPLMGDSSPCTSPTWMHPMGIALGELHQCGSLFYEMRSLRHSLFQCGSPTGCQVLPGNLCQTPLCTGLQVFARNQIQHSFPMVHSLLSGISLLREPPPQSEGGSLHTHGISWAAEAQLLYHCLNHELQGDLLLLLLHWPWCA